MLGRNVILLNRIRYEVPYPTGGNRHNDALSVDVSTSYPWYLNFTSIYKERHKKQLSARGRGHVTLTESTLTINNSIPYGTTFLDYGTLSVSESANRTGRVTLTAIATTSTTTASTLLPAADHFYCLAGWHRRCRILIEKIRVRYAA